ncbi:diguanylate cyclase [Ferrimonas lipolytica]|uniref:diguanylate cyclase n=1 Tax=Ferrimonas lipolytica TaxID=2724191 RepID=A0A6H1UFE2_9GAMM|nr:diguanylate cyclase [Ferrimonas lipolytica]QIZ77764.1 sensor domain-containing diguanylate cyclase [Ferrimonas lipolytica]
MDNHEFEQLHWLTQLLQGIEVGLVVIDRDYKVKLWNGFMENHSGVLSNDVLEQSLFERFPELPQQWLLSKLESAFLLESRSFTVWEQRPWVFSFANSRPITGGLEKMHQNMTIQPLKNSNGNISHAALVIYDVSVQAQDRMKLTSANDRLEQLSQVDGLTGLTNRRQWESLLEREFHRCSRYDQSSSLVVLDIDNFKLVNDQRGHAVGDKVLVGLANLLKSCLRKSDCIARYGGEEFVIILTETSPVQAQLLAERIRETVEQMVFDLQPPLKVTVSLGVCGFRKVLTSPKQWFELADQALYRSKNEGRNRLTMV